MNFLKDLPSEYQLQGDNSKKPETVEIEKPEAVDLKTTEELKVLTLEGKVKALEQEKEMEKITGWPRKLPDIYNGPTCSTDKNWRYNV